MIFFNDIELDYYGNTLNQLIIKRALTDIENLSDRKGTSSTTFDVPRTAHNEKTFGYISDAGAISTPIGTSRIEIDGNVYSQGIIYVVGIDSDNFKCNYFGSDVEIVRGFESSKLYELIPITEVLQFTDTNFRTNLQSINTSSVIDWVLYNPLATADTLKLETIAPIFSTKNIIERIFQDYTIVSSFLQTNYAINSYFGSYSGKHMAFNNTVGNTINLTGLPQQVSVGNMSTSSNITKSGNNYVIGVPIESLKVRLIAEASELSNIYIWVFNSSGAIIGRSISTILTEGKNIISFNLDKSIPANSYIYFGISGGTNGTVDISNVEIHTDNIQLNDYVSLRSYIGDIDVKDFVADFQKHHNLVMDIDGNVLYIDPQDKCNAPIGNQSITPLRIAEQDITNDISNIIDISFEFKQANIIIFDQKAISNGTIDDYEVQLSQFKNFGGYYHKTQTFGNQTETISTLFNTNYDMVDNIQAGSTSPIIPELYTSWDNILTCRHSFFGTFGDTFSGIYTNNDTTTTNVNPYWFTAIPCRFSQIAPTLFKETLNQKNNNRIIEVRLFDKLGTLINFRTTYIIDNQKYKLINYDYDIISKEVIAKLALII